MTACSARPERHDPSTIRCTKCGIAWDKDDPEVPVCLNDLMARGPLENPTWPLPYVSGLPGAR